MIKRVSFILIMVFCLFATLTNPSMSQDTLGSRKSWRVLDSLFVDFIDKDTGDTLQFVVPVKFNKAAIFDTTFTNYAQRDSTDTLVYLGTFDVEWVRGTYLAGLNLDKRLNLEANAFIFTSIDSPNVHLAIGEDATAGEGAIIKVQEVVDKSINTISGIEIDISNDGDGISTTLYGVWSKALHTSGTTAKAVGVYGYVSKFTGTLTTGTGVEAYSAGADSNIGIKATATGVGYAGYFAGNVWIPDSVLYIGSDRVDVIDSLRYMIRDTAFVITNSLGDTLDATQNINGNWTFSTADSTVFGKITADTFFVADSFKVGHTITINGSDIFINGVNILSMVSDTGDVVKNVISDTLADYIADEFSLDSLVLYLPMDYNTNDYSGGKNDPDSAVGVTLRTQPDSFMVGRAAYSFDGNDYINIDEALTDLSGTIVGTWSAWLRMDDATPANPACVVGFGDYDAQERVEILVKTDGKVEAELYDSGVIGWWVETDAQVVFDDVWIHIALVHNGTEPVLYIDGSKVAQTFQNDDFKNKWFPELAGLDNGKIGCLNNDTSPNGNFVTGLIDELFIYKRALTSSEIWNYYYNSDIFNLQIAGHGLYINTTDSSLNYNSGRGVTNIAGGTKNVYLSVFSGYPDSMNYNFVQWRNKVTISPQVWKSPSKDTIYNVIYAITDSTNPQSYNYWIPWHIPDDFYSWDTDSAFTVRTAHDTATTDVYAFSNSNVTTDSIKILNIATSTTGWNWKYSNAAGATLVAAGTDRLNWNPGNLALFRFQLALKNGHSIRFSDVRLRYNKK